MISFTEAMCTVYRACPTLADKVRAYQACNDDLDREILKVAMLTNVYVLSNEPPRLFNAIRHRWTKLCERTS